MKSKRFISAFTVSIFSLLLSVNASAESTIDESKFGDVLVSFLYFAGVLALIYLILYLVNRWGKKHQNEGNEATANKSKMNKENSEDTENNEDKTNKGENEE